MSVFPVGWLSSRWGWLVVWTAIVLSLGALVLIFHLAHLHPWAGIDPGRVAWYHKEQCETVDTTGFLLQFHNFWSNAAYLAVGLLVLCCSTTGHGRFVGIAFVFLAAGSGWFHGTLSESGQTVDIMGVYVALLAVAAYGFIEMVPITSPLAIWSILGAATALGVAGALLRGSVRLFDSDAFTPLLVVIVVGFMAAGMFRPSAGRSRIALLVQLGVIFAFGVLALILKYTDGTNNLLARHDGRLADCLWGKTSVMQGHAHWHILSAIMFLCMFEFFRSMGGRSRSVWPWRGEG
jgi:hypothetical protein